MLQWMKDQANLVCEKGDAQLELPKFDYQNVRSGGRRLTIA